MTDIATGLSALSWFADAGVDTLVDEHPRQWLALPDAAAMPLPQAAEPAAPAAPPAPPAPAAVAGADIPAFATIEDMTLFLAQSPIVPARSPRPPLLSAGTPGSDLMLLADAPGPQDVEAGAPFAGDAGLLLDRMLAAIGRDRSNIYLANFLPWRDPAGLAADNRAFWVKMARRHIALAAPTTLILFGNTVTEALLGAPVANIRGRWHKIDIDGLSIPAIVSFTPAHLLRVPAHKAQAWADLQLWMKGPAQ